MSVINVENVGMTYKLSADRITSFKGYFVAALKKEIKRSEHRVFRNLNFEVEKGDVVGIIGRNGAGKSTLLKIIAGVLNPTEGKVSVTGNIVPMLELGSGFDFDLTGRENVFLNGSILGYSEKFLNEKYDEIVAFSELGEFIEQPIRNYSSGMIARLAFAIATVVEPEILIVDEILAVGDEAFQRKSKRKMLSLMGGGCTVLFVSHSVAQIREMCTKVLWLEDGKMRMFGDTKKVCDAYQEFLNPKKMNDDEDPTAQVLDIIRKKCRDVMYVFGKRDLNYYYRTGVGKEELFASRIEAGEIYHKYLDDEILHKNNIFIFSECPKSDEIIKAINELHSCGKTILFDITSEEDDGIELLNSVYEKVDGIIVAKDKLVTQFSDKKVFVNPFVASDRIMQLSDWAVYDKEVLPFISEEDITSEDMMINYNRAKAELQEKQKYKRNIVFINDGLSNDAINNVIQSLIRLLTTEPGCRLITLDKWEKQFKTSLVDSKVEFIKKPAYEALPRIISKADEVLIYSDTECNDFDVVLQIVARLVKTQISFISSNGDIVTRKNDVDAECTNEHARNTVFMAKYFRSFLSSFSRKKCGVIVNSISERDNELLERLIGVFPNELQVVILCMEGKTNRHIKLGNKEIPVYSISENYMSMHFSAMVAFSYDNYEFLKNYESVDSKIYLVDSYESYGYDDGDFRRFSSNRLFYEHPEIKLMTLNGLRNVPAIDSNHVGMKQIYELTKETFC